MRLVLPLLLLMLCSAGCLSAEEGVRPAKLPDEAHRFDYVYDANAVESFGIHLSDGVYVLFSTVVSAENGFRRDYYAYKMIPELNRENGMEGATLLSRQIGEAKTVHVRSPGEEVPPEKRTLNILGRTYLVLGSLSLLSD